MTEPRPITRLAVSLGAFGIAEHRFFGSTKVEHLANMVSLRFLSDRDPDMNVVLRTDAGDCMVNGYLALIWLACVATREETIVVSFAKTAQWLASNTFEKASESGPVQFKGEHSTAWLMPLRGIPTDVDPILDLRGAP